MRLFIAVTPPEHVLDAAEEAVREALGEHPDPGLRWTRREDRHITLLFLGETAPGRLPALEQAFTDELARHGPERVALRGAGTFPGDDSAATVLWAGVQGEHTASPLAGPAAGLRRAARTGGVRVERRPFVPHLTLARSRRPAHLSALRTALGALATPFWEAGEVHLVESRPRDRGRRYRTAATWALG
ncbi:RNA 2',3'-cyclic phosphodiesterase [Nocardiopsis baichengensis]|uniref:RNA 2',3'-cyclic phosphodiesterase n=1 Tax=Nocardiopsis baichengensis TaxID=280240 RepID=UPI00034A5A5C|nr:RNA 2',3'-cyclic phosphodiesterase [Nocardiopsis baichengensis]